MSMEYVKMPLIEYFLVVGISTRELSKEITSHPIDISILQRLPLHILEEYKSNRLSQPSTHRSTYINNILTFCFPNGVDIKETHNNYITKIISFSIFAEDRRKHVTCFSFYENYLINNQPFAVQKCFCLVSSKELYSTHQEILHNIYNIITSSRVNRSKYIFLKDKTKSDKYTVVQESKILEFYISFILNTIWSNPVDKDKRGICVKYSKNNSGYSVFANYHIENKHQIPIKDYDISILVDRFNIEDLIDIYIALLIEYKVIIVFEDYTEINQIIFSLISILYPLNWKLLPLISFITKEMTDMLEAPLSYIIGSHISFLPVILSKIKEGSITSNTVIYNLTQKKFILIDENFPQLTLSLFNELKSDLTLLISDRNSVLSQLKFNAINTHTYAHSNRTHAFTLSDIDNKSEFFSIFQLNGEYISLSPIVYFNYKLVSTFYKTFVNIIRNIDKCINWDYVNQQTVIKPRTQLSEYFDYNKFQNDPRCIGDPIFLSFMKNLTESMKLTEFLRKYLFRCFNKDEGKYYNAHYLISLYNSSRRINLKEEVDKYMRIKMIEAICYYHNYIYVSLDNATSDYLKVFKDLSISKRDNMKEYVIWPPIEIYKIMSRTFSYKDYIIQSPIYTDNDNDTTNDLPYEKTFNELCELLINNNQINIDDNSNSNSNMNISRSSEKKSPSFKEKEFLDDLIKKFNSKSPGAKLDNKSEYLATPKGNYHRHKSSQSNESSMTNPNPNPHQHNSLSFCLQPKHSHEHNTTSQFKLKLIASKADIKIDKTQKSISSFSPQIEINDASTVGETIKESISYSLFTHTNSNPLQATITLSLPIKKHIEKSPQDMLFSNHHISHIQKLEGDNDDFGIFSDG